MKRKSNMLVVTSIFISLLAVGFGYDSGWRQATVIPGAVAAQDNPFDRARTRDCSLSTARGTYGFALVGNVVGVGPISTSGTTIFDGQGLDTGAFKVTTSESLQQFTFTGTYTVNNNCTGTATLNITPPVFGRSVLHFDAVGTNDTKEIKWLITDPGVILAGTLTKQ
jgi:hypothetical protein